VLSEYTSEAAPLRMSCVMGTLKYSDGSGSVWKFDLACSVALHKTNSLPSKLQPDKHPQIGTPTAIPVPTSTNNDLPHTATLEQLLYVLGDTFVSLNASISNAADAELA
jgi:hypothetical protein